MKRSTANPQTTALLPPSRNISTSECLAGESPAGKDIGSCVRGMRMQAELVRDVQAGRPWYLSRTQGETHSTGEGETHNGERLHPERSSRNMQRTTNRCARTLGRGVNGGLMISSWQILSSATPATAMLSVQMQLGLRSTPLFAHDRVMRIPVLT